jgi:hypothetical protein
VSTRCVAGRALFSLIFCLQLPQGGNKRFRQAISNSLEAYRQAATRTDKAVIVQHIVDGVVNVGGRFLKKDNSAGHWYELNEQATKEKVSHAVRDAVNTMDSRKTHQGISGGSSNPSKVLKPAPRDKGEEKEPPERGLLRSLSRGSIGSGNFYDNLDRAAREIRRHTGQHNDSWFGVDPAYNPPTPRGHRAMLHGTGERLHSAERLPLLRDIQMPGIAEQARAMGSFVSNELVRATTHDVMESRHASVPQQPVPQQHSFSTSLQDRFGGGPPLSSPPEGQRLGFASMRRPVRSEETPPQGSLAAPLQPPPQQPSPPDEGDNMFLARINEVLGPLPSDEGDPVANYLDPRRPR